MSGHDLAAAGLRRRGLLGLLDRLLALLRPALPAGYGFGEVRLPQFEPWQKRQSQNRLRAGQMDARLASARAPLELRMNALMAVQQLPPRHASGLLRDALGEPADDLRLLAYGILDGKEKQITARIHATREALQAASAREDIYQLGKQLAELHLELVYQGLVQGELRRHTLEQGRQYAAQALHHHVHDAGLWLLAGRLHLLSGEQDRARTAFDTALLLGLPPARVHPYLAELAFLRRDFASVRALLQKIAGDRHTQQMALLIDYWRQRDPVAPANHCSNWSEHDPATGTTG